MFRSRPLSILSISIALSMLAGCGDLVAAATPPAACEPMRQVINTGATRVGALADRVADPAGMGQLADEQEGFAASVAAVSTDDPELIAVRDEYVAVYRAMAAATRRGSSVPDEAAIAAIEAELEALADREEAAARRFESRCP